MAKVHGVVIDAVDSSVMDEFIEQFDLNPEGDSDAEKVFALMEHFKASVPKDDLVKCDDCEGVSDYSLPKCPFCGASDEEEEVEPKPEPEPEPEPESEPKRVKKVVGKAPKPAKKAATKKAATKKPAKKAATKKAATTAIEVDSKYNEDDLNEAVEEANRLYNDVGNAFYKLGLQIQRIHGERLWMLRAGDDGTPKYSSFEAFVKAELAINRQTALEYLDVARNYAEEDVNEIGYKKCALLLKAKDDSVPEATQALLRKKADAGMSFRDLEKEVKRVREEVGLSKRTTGRKEMPAGKAPAKKAEALTVASLLKQETISLLKSPKKSAGKGNVPATSLDDEPWGMLELENGVIEVFKIRVAADGTLKLVVKRERAKK
jgi:hypothetical protein